MAKNISVKKYPGVFTYIEAPKRLTIEWKHCCSSLFVVCSIEHIDIFVLGFLFDMLPISLALFAPASHFPELGPLVN